jgi:hypothetical protein
LTIGNRFPKLAGRYQLRSDGTKLRARTAALPTTAGPANPVTAGAAKLQFPHARGADFVPNRDTGSVIRTRADRKISAHERCSICSSRRKFRANFLQLDCKQNAFRYPFLPPTQPASGVAFRRRYARMARIRPPA